MVRLWEWRVEEEDGGCGQEVEAEREEKSRHARSGVTTLLFQGHG